LTETRRQRRPTDFFFAIWLAIWLALPAFGQPSEAEKLIEAGHWKQARAIVEERIRQVPEDPLANFLLSQIRNAFGDTTSPHALAEKAVTLDGRVAKYHRQLAEVLGVEAQHAGPLKILLLAHQFRGEIDTAISLDPHDVQAQRDLLEYYLVAPGIAGGDIQKATTTADHIAELNAPEGFLAKARIAAFRRQTSQAEAQLRKATQAQPPSYRALTELAKFYLTPEHLNPTDAESAARDMLKLDRDRVDAYAILAQIYAQTGDWQALDAVLADGLRLVPDDLTPYYRAADTLLGNGRDPLRAARYLRVYLDHEPEGNAPLAADARRRLTLALQAQSHRPTGSATKRPS
jgi:tetratricopeptide (TPR) repeat protein